MTAPATTQHDWLNALVGTNGSHILRAHGRYDPPNRPKVLAGGYGPDARQQLWDTATRRAAGYRVEIAPNPLKCRISTREELTLMPKAALPDNSFVERCTVLLVALVLRDRSKRALTQDDFRVRDECIARLQSELQQRGWPEPLVSRCHGHLLYKIDLPTTETALIRRALRGLDALVSASRFAVDGTRHQALVWLPMYGVLPGEVPPVPPPGGLTVVSTELLKAIAPEKAKRRPPDPSESKMRDVFRPFPLPEFVPADRRLMLTDWKEEPEGPVWAPVMRWVARWARTVTGQPSPILPALVLQLLTWGFKLKSKAIDEAQKDFERALGPKVIEKPNTERAYPCPDGCGFQLRWCGYHHTVSLPPNLLGAAEHGTTPPYARPWPHAVPTPMPRPADLEALGWTAADAAEYGPVYLPLVALARSPGLKLDPGPMRLLTHLSYEIWRDPAGMASPRPDWAIVVTGSTASAAAGGCALLKAGQSYVSLGSHSTNGLGHQIGPSTDPNSWAQQVAAWSQSKPDTATTRLILDHLKYLTRWFGLIVAGFEESTETWVTLRTMLQWCDTPAGLNRVAGLHLRVYTLADYPTRWKARFAHRLGFGKSQSLPSVQESLAVKRMKPRPTTIQFAGDSPSVCRVTTVHSNLIGLMYERILRSCGKYRGLRGDPAAWFMPFMGTNENIVEEPTALPWHVRPDYPRSQKAARQRAANPTPYQSFLMPTSFVPLVQQLASEGLVELTIDTAVAPLTLAPVPSFRAPILDARQAALFEAVRKSPRGVIDCAGDPQAMEQLMTSLVTWFPDDDIVVIAEPKSSGEDLARVLSTGGGAFQTSLGNSQTSQSSPTPPKLVIPARTTGLPSPSWPSTVDLVVAMDALDAANTHGGQLLGPGRFRAYGFVNNFESMSSLDASKVLRCFGDVIFRAR